MGVVSFIRRRILVKIHPVFKRVVFPVLGMLLLIQVLTITDRKSQLPEVMPGEALDPLVSHKLYNSKDKRPAQPFDGILKSAAEVDEKRFGENGFEDEQEEEKIKPQETFLKQKKNEDYLNKKEKMQQQKFTKKLEKKEAEKSVGKQQPRIGQKKKSDVKEDKEWSMAKLNIPGHDQVEFEGHKITEKTVTLTVMSSSDKVFMSLNKREIYRGLDERGIHIVVLHPHTGLVMAGRVFDTFYNGTETDMAEFLDDIQDGRIIVFAVRDEAATGLTWRGRSKLREYGAKFADKLAYRDMWILVTRKGGLKLAESYSNVAIEDTAYEWGGPLFLRTDFDLADLSDPCDWEDKDMHKRQSFCQKYEGYGKLCNCKVKTMENAFFQADGKAIDGIIGSELYHDLAIAVLASNRPNYLFKTLKSLREAPGYNSGRVIVYVEKEHQEIADLVDLLGVQLVVTGKREGDNVTASMHVRDKIQFIFRDVMGASFSSKTIPSGMDSTPGSPTLTANHLVLLDDDVKVSVDFFKYMHRLAPILSKDDTILGITAINYNSYVFVAESLSTFYRTDRPHHLALMLPAKSVHERIVPDWPVASSRREWYSTISVAMEKKKSLDIIVPEVSRAKHFGYTGHKIMGSIQYAFFQDHTLSLTTDYKIPQQNIDRLILSSYETWRMETLKESDPTSFNFCLYDQPYGKDRKVIFVEYDGGDEDQQITALLKCLGAWHIYPEGSWRNTWDFVYHGHPTTVVAVPASQYSYLKPDNYQMMNLTADRESHPH